MNKSKKHFNGTNKAKERRKRVIERLEVQKKLGTKTVKDSIISPNTGKKIYVEVPLEERDYKRIDKELETLKNRV